GRVTGSTVPRVGVHCPPGDSRARSAPLTRPTAPPRSWCPETTPACSFARTSRTPSPTQMSPVSFALSTPLRLYPIPLWISELVQRFLRSKNGPPRARLYLNEFEKPMLLMDDENGVRVSLGAEQSDTPSIDIND